MLECEPALASRPGSAPRPDWFAILATAYLLLPSFIFLLTWVRPWLGVPVALILMASFVLFVRQNAAIEARPRLSAGTWTWLLAWAFCLTLLAGIGGYVWQASDYEKHNLAFHDLLNSPWPVYYSNGPETHYLCYGLGYYLAPALVARAGGEAWLAPATFFWACAGVGLFFYWVSTFNAAPKRTLAFVLLFAATETLWHMYLRALHTGHFAESGNLIRQSLDRLGLMSDYSDSYSELQYRPQHVISGWLGTALFYDLFWVRRTARGAGLVWAACWLWSPLMSLGLLLVPLAAIRRRCWRQAVEPVNCGALVLMGVLAVYFLGHVPLTEKGPICKFATDHEWVWLYPCFLLLQLTPLLWLYLADRKYQLLGELRPLFRAAAALLVLLPLYKIGYYGDQRLQGQTPALLICGLAASGVFLSPGFKLKRPLFMLLVASQLVGALYPAGRWWQEALSGQELDYSYAAVNHRYGYQNLSELRRFGYDYASQYLGRTNSAAARWLLR